MGEVKNITQVSNEGILVVENYLLQPIFSYNNLSHKKLTFEVLFPMLIGYSKPLKIHDPIFRNPTDTLYMIESYVLQSFCIILKFYFPYLLFQNQNFSTELTLILY